MSVHVRRSQKCVASGGGGSLRNAAALASAGGAALAPWQLRGGAEPFAAGLGCAGVGDSVANSFDQSTWSQPNTTSTVVSAGGWPTSAPWSAADGNAFNSSYNVGSQAESQTEGPRSSAGGWPSLRAEFADLDEVVPYLESADLKTPAARVSATMLQRMAVEAFDLSRNHHLLARLGECAVDLVPYQWNSQVPAVLVRVVPKNGSAPSWMQLHLAVHTLGRFAAVRYSKKNYVLVPDLTKKADDFLEAYGWYDALLRGEKTHPLLTKTILSRPNVGDVMQALKSDKGKLKEFATIFPPPKMTWKYAGSLNAA